MINRNVFTQENPIRPRRRVTFPPTRPTQNAAPRLDGTRDQPAPPGVPSSWRTLSFAPACGLYITTDPHPQLAPEHRRSTYSEEHTTTKTEACRPQERPKAAHSNSGLRQQTQPPRATLTFTLLHLSARIHHFKLPLEDASPRPLDLPAAFPAVRPLCMLPPPHRRLS
ncbi:uncharacterized protein ACIQIH_006614 isoform 2-T6 [Cyanocitta cristata]